MSEIMDSEPQLPQGAPVEQPKLEQEAGPKPVDPALLEKLDVLRALSKIDTLLSNCLFLGGVAGDIQTSKHFIQKLHAPILAECQSHPDFERATKPAPAAPTSSLDRSLKAKADEKRARKEAKTKRQRSN